MICIKCRKFVRELQRIHLGTVQKHYWGGVEAFRFALVKSGCPLSEDGQNLDAPSEDWQNLVTTVHISFKNNIPISVMWPYLNYFKFFW